MHTFKRWHFSCVFLMWVSSLTFCVSLPKAWLGIAFEDVLIEKIPLEYRPLTVEGPVKVLQAFKGASAEQAGILVGDFVLGINGTLLKGRKNLLDTVQSKSVGAVVELSIGRGGKILKLKMALSPKPEDMKTLTQSLVGSPAPELRGTYYQYESGALSKMTGKVVLLDFWATWCGPCRMTIPALQAISGRYRDKLVVIGISSEDKETLEAFKTKTGQNYPLFQDVGQLTTRAYAAFAYPTLVLVDKKGIVQRIEVGAHSEQSIEKWVKELM